MVWNLMISRLENKFGWTGILCGARGAPYSILKRFVNAQIECLLMIVKSNQIEDLNPETRESLGFVFVADISDSVMKYASVAATIQNPNKLPPWIVVAHSLQSIVVAKWPGRLWKVKIIEIVPEQPNISAKYTRATAVQILEERSVSELFGRHGEVVCKIIAKAQNLQFGEIQILEEAKNPLAIEAYSRAWKNWLAQVMPTSGHLEDDLSCTLSIYATDKGKKSPVNDGFTVLYDIITQRAQILVGDAAFEIDNEGERAFTPVWFRIFNVFLHAVMAYGAPEIMSSTDNELLKVTWIKYFGTFEET
jgi:hypothetical protein